MMDLSTSYRGKRVLVTGHTGFKGAWLCEWLLRLGAEVSGYSLEPATDPSLFTTLGLDKRMASHIGDVRDLSKLIAQFRSTKPDFAFHLAAQAIVLDSYDSPVGTFGTNVMGTVNFLEAVRLTDSVGAAVVVTTDKCYENKEWEFPYRENDRLGGKDPYSASKAAAEIASSAYFRSFFNTPAVTRCATARAGNVIGGGDWSAHRIVADCARSWSKNTTVVLRNPKSVRPWQHVLEPLGGYLQLGILLARGAADTHGQAFNFGPTEESHETVESIVRLLQSHWPGTNVELAKMPAADLPAKEAGLLKLDWERARVRLGWRPTLKLSESLEMTANWYRAFYARTTDMTELTRGQIERYETLARERGN